MKTKYLILSLTTIIALSLYAPLLNINDDVLVQTVAAEEVAPPAAPAQPEAKAPAAKAEEPAKKAEDYDWKIGDKVTPEKIAEIVANAIAAAGQKGSFWLNPSLWEVIFTIVMIIIGILATKFGWDKAKWGKIIKAVETAVRTVYIEFVREAKLKNVDHKLTKEEVEESLKRAWDLTKDDLAKQGIDLAVWITKEYFPTIVDKVIKLVKK
jgi:Sec-independent protein translocase protein TatA